MKEIKTKPEGGKPKLLESAAKAPKTAMKDLWLKSKEKSVSEIKETPFASQQESPSMPRPTLPGIRCCPAWRALPRRGGFDLSGRQKAGADYRQKVREKHEVARIRKRAEGPASKAASQTGKAAKSAASKIKTKNAVVNGVKGKTGKSGKNSQQNP